MKRYLFVVSFCLLQGVSYGFSTLEQARSYGATIPQYPDSDSDDLETPDYTTLYESLTPSWWQRIKQALWLRQPSIWNPASIMPLIEKLLERSTGILPAPDLTISVTPGTRFTILAGIHGDFHTLINIITDLETKGHIANDLTLKKGHYLVFLGNAIDYSAYSLETLALIASLMIKNKDQVLYLSGMHEQKQTWHKYGLKKELHLRLPKQEVHLTSAINKLAAQLPSLVWLSYASSKERLALSTTEPQSDYRVLITGDEQLRKFDGGRGLYKKILSDQKIIWRIVSAPVRLYRIRHRFFYESYSEIEFKENLTKSTITNYYSFGKFPFSQGDSYLLTQGELVIRGVVLPAITSPLQGALAPLQLYQRIETLSEQVNNLAQKVAEIHKQLPLSKIAPTALVENPVLTRLKAGEKLSDKELQTAASEVERLYNILTKEVESLVKRAKKEGLTTSVSQPKNLDDTITLGSSLDVSKSVKGLGIPFRSGMALKVNKQNREGGIHGKRVQIVFLDDGYLASVARQNIEMLLNRYKTPYIISPIGTPTLLASMDLIQSKKILVLFPQSGSPIFRNPELTNIINFRASFADEGLVLTEYVLKTYFPKNFAFFYQDDSFGISILEGAKEALKEAKISKVTEARYLANTTYFKEAAETIKAANPDVIGFFATGPATVQLIRDLGVEFLANKILYAVSSVGDNATVKILKDRGLKVIMGQVVPDPKTSTLPLVEEYREELKKQGLKENVFSLEAYLTTSITFDALEKIKEPITMQKIIHYFEGIKDYTYKGISLRFNPKTRTLSHKLWINPEDGGPWKEMELSNQGGAHAKS